MVRVHTMVYINDETADGTKKQVIFWVIKLSLTFTADIWQASSNILLMDYEKIELPQITLQLLVCVRYVLNEKPK